MSKVPYCDNKAVGVIIKNANGAIALLQRVRYPFGVAPPAGHIDQHGTAEQAAIDEVKEEVDLSIALDQLKPTAIYNRLVSTSKCRRPGGSYHYWHVYEVANFDGELHPSPDEAKSAGWYALSRIQALADRTKLFQAGQISQVDWQANPGLEEVWLDFFRELGYIN